MARCMMSFHIGYYAASGNTNQHFARHNADTMMFRSDLDLLRGLTTLPCGLPARDLDTLAQFVTIFISPPASMAVNRFSFPR